MSFFPHHSQAHPQSASPATACLASTVTTGIVLACMLSLGVRAFSIGTRATLDPVREDLAPGAELARSSGSADGQVVVGLGDVKINIEAYNKKREKDIADASGKLLTLAIALKAELEHDPASDASPTTVLKAKEIQKLAREVKEMMKLNMVGPH
jgi:hypothetical protein